MSVSDKIKGLLALSGKKQIELAEAFDMSKQTMGNKMNRGSWSARDLAKVAEFCGCKLTRKRPGRGVWLISWYVRVIRCGS